MTAYNYVKSVFMENKTVSTKRDFLFFFKKNFLEKQKYTKEP